MSDERLDKLGNYFIYHQIHPRYGITFERFVHLVNNGLWSEYVKEEYQNVG